MEKIDPHKSHSYSHDYMLMTAFDFELRNYMQTKCQKTNETAVVQEYLEKRIKEIKERWK